MEGYSVTEAASILGVPTERVWELLARGVLSGSPEAGTPAPESRSASSRRFASC
jgi:DNA-directed RNA polymerase specialized sigma24 family protein